MTCVREFHAAFGLEAPPAPPLRPAKSVIQLRMRLIAEEYKEVMKELQTLAFHQSTLTPARNVEVYRCLLKELADLRYVVEGGAVDLGLPIDAAYAEVHRSNMSKLGPGGLPIRDAGGKVLKGPNYTPADMAQFVPQIITLGDPS